MTTQHATRSGTLNNYFYKFEFVIEGNYDSIVLNMTNFITIMTTQLADLLRISVSSFGQVFVYRGFRNTFDSFIHLLIFFLVHIDSRG